jgi:tetratricopeptide (TPR) repeat protein
MDNKSYVNVWEETVVFPTYEIGESQKNPMFLEKRVYQGSSGVVYPNAVIESVADIPIDKSYQAIYLENQYLKIMVLPELGGRIQMAYDKVKERHFVYFNQVIKPALVGLTGPWISGGIEFNWPQHHRPSTFEAIDFKIEENQDGSKTVWVSEIERMYSTKGMAGFTLYPDTAYLEIKGVLYNRTTLPQTFLWWANPAVKVNDHYQSIFPPDVNAVFDHGRRDVSSFPIATGTYYKVDYSPGTDISGYKNIPVPTSYMAINSKYNFLGGYEHDTRAGILHIANRHISPGKKQWTWGNGEFGYAWDRNLTDQDGPYIELMTGVFTDNQPDFSWIMPNEERRFTQYFMPYNELGHVKNASKDLVINLEFSDIEYHIMVYASSIQNDLIVELFSGTQLVFTEKMSVSPSKIYSRKNVENLADTENLELYIKNSKGKVLISYIPEKNVEGELPEAAIAAKQPNEIESNEQLYLTGLHIEQYRHATYIATDYYKEALRRDPQDTRSNNAMGLWNYKKGQFSKAKGYFEKAIATLIQRNPNPYDSEAYYNLGLCLIKLEHYEEAYTAFYKATWAAAWQDVAFLELARLATIKKDHILAIEHAEDAINRNYKGHAARNVLIANLRINGDSGNALKFIHLALEMDSLNAFCIFEKYLLLKNSQTSEALVVLNDFKKLMRGYVHNYIEYAFEYMSAGLFDEASELLEIYINTTEEIYPIVLYLAAYLADKLNKNNLKLGFLANAQLANPDFVFPNRLNEKIILEWALVQNDDANAWYFLGNFWYASRQYDDAIACWEKSAALQPRFATVRRNLSLAYFNKQKMYEKSLESMQLAFDLDNSDARVLMELDQLYKIMNYDVSFRLQLLQTYLHLVKKRDDLYLEFISLLNLTYAYDEAKMMLSNRIFHPWEGGEGKVIGQYLFCYTELAKREIENQRYDIAIQLLNEAKVYPHNLGEGKIYGTQENDIDYLLGLCFELMGNEAEAKGYFEKATFGLDEPVQAVFYNDQQPDKLLYQGLAWKKLGHHLKASEIFDKLINFGKKHESDQIKIDFFAVSLPDLLVFDIDLNHRNFIHCHYMIGLGYLGNGSFENAIQYFDNVLSMSKVHLGAMAHKNLMLLDEKILAI